MTNKFRYGVNSWDGNEEYEKALQAFNDGFKLAKTDKGKAIEKFEEAERFFYGCGAEDKAELARENIRIVQSNNEPKPFA
jgi:hypothetical protein